MLTCSKLYGDIPFAHRQPQHDGHCAFIHGHNWSFKLTFSSKELDKNGFVVDFGKLKSIKQWIDKNLDHACLLCHDDPILQNLETETLRSAFKLYVIEDASSEGLAVHLFEVFNKVVCELTNMRAQLISLEVFEDMKNSARYTP